jgi:malonate transporter and related proteins
MTILTTILPLFAIIATGFGITKTGYYPARHMIALGDLVMRVALPSLILLAVVNARPEERLNPTIILAYAAGSLVWFGIVLVSTLRLFKFSIGQSAIVALGSSSSTSGYLGYPVAFALFGTIASTTLTQCVIAENVIMLPLALLLAESNQDVSLAKPKLFFRYLILQLLKNPLLIAALLGLVFANSGFLLPLPVSKALEFLSQMTGPAALLVVGMTLADLPMQRKELWGAVGIGLNKLLGHPLVIAAVFWLLPGLSAQQRNCIVIFAAVPMLTILPVFGQKVGLAPLAALALLVAVAICPLTIPVILSMINFQ